MVEPGTGLMILGSAVGSAKVVEKILGPTADYLGLGLRNWTEKSAANVGRIFQIAKDRLGDRIEQPGTVPLKVLKHLLQEGPFCDDVLAAEYFSGVLASSRTEVGRDDRGASFAALTARLTSYQIRSHCFFYSVLRSLFVGTSFELTKSEDRSKCAMFIPLVAYYKALELSESENLDVIVPHVMFGLSRENLIDTNNFQWGSAEDLKQRGFKSVDRAGLVLTPSALGAELFMWAFGKGHLSLNAILHDSAGFQSPIQFHTTSGARSIQDPERMMK